MKVYVTEGTMLLPQCFCIEDIANENLLMPQRNNGDTFIENKIADSDFQLSHVDKTVKRISNHQSRWLTRHKIQNRRSRIRISKRT